MSSKAAATAKHALREAVLRRRAARSPGEITAAGDALARQADRFANCRVVAAFLSTPTEPPTRPLLAALLAEGREVIVPVVAGDALDWTRYDGGAPATTTRLGIEEPAGPRLGSAALREADVVLVPALAVDPLGNRLGRGLGYYDRALAHATNPVVAVVFDDELVDEVPTEPHDRRASAVLRPAGWLEL